MKVIIKNKRVLILLVFLPLCLYHLLVPLHYLNLRPYNGTAYYFNVLLIGVLTLVPIAFSIMVLSSMKMNMFYKVISFVLIVYGSFGIAGSISFQRKENHLNEYGKMIDAKIINSKTFSSYKRVYFSYTIGNKKHYGILDIKENIEESSSSFKIIVSTKDSRIYDSF